LTTEQGAQATYDADKKAAEDLNDKTIEYTILSKEALESDQLYQDLLKHLKEAGILGALHSTPLTIVDIGRTPDKPDHPNIPLFLCLGFFGGVLLGTIAALLTDAIDNKVRGIEEIEAMGLPLLGIMPQFTTTEQAGKFVLLDTRSSEFSEAVRHLRSALLISRSGKPPEVLLITSGSPAEGKSTVSLNLAAALAQYKKRVLLVEGDLRRPVFKARLNLQTSEGLSTLLADLSTTVEPEALPEHPGLYILPAGPQPPYPSELLGAAPLESIIDGWRQKFDFILIDSPPILPVTDAQILVAHADTTVLIARTGRTSRVGLQRAFKLLLPHAKSAAEPSIGILLNGVSRSSAAYYGYYGHYGYKNYYGAEGDKND
jgi:capsular exopolysaccharide synthesis family protein